jgi:hypothetical protein
MPSDPYSALRDHYDQTWERVFELEEENERLRAEVEACDGHGYLREEIKRLRAAHEALLNTLAPSRSSWVQWVYRNAKAHYETLRGGEDAD